MEQKIKSNYSLGKRLRALRLESGFQVTELARYMQLAGCDTTRECLVKIEAGRHHISVQQLKTIKEALDVTYEQIFEDLPMEE
jgi:transcriptional regulator with XRE-family HTH domain